MRVAKHSRFRFAFCVWRVARRDSRLAIHLPLGLCKLAHLRAKQCGVLLLSAHLDRMHLTTICCVCFQKLYRFINTVELVSPHHSAKEIITNLREGQIASLFQKSVKRVRFEPFFAVAFNCTLWLDTVIFAQKAKEEARRRKSKSQFFEMIQEVRKV